MHWIRRLWCRIWRRAGGEATQKDGDQIEGIDPHPQEVCDELLVSSALNELPIEAYEFRKALLELPELNRFGGASMVSVERELLKLWNPAWESDLQYLEAPPEWGLHLTKEFRKNISGIDRKLQGRVLEALSEISSSPLSQRGNTIKPLSKNLRGYWRYRLGDHRLVYYPDPAAKNVTILCFAARQAVYDRADSTGAA